MLFSAKVQYGLKALIVLASAKEPLLVRDLAKQAKVPIAFLGKIISELSAAGIVSTRKGKGDGVSINSDPKNVSLVSCIESIDRVQGRRSCVLENRPCREVGSCPFHKVAERIRVEFLERTTLADLAQDPSWLT